MRRSILGAVLTLTGLVLTGCSDPGAGTPAGVSAAPSSTATGTALYAVDSRTLDEIVIDAQGFVLYRSDRDTAAPTWSACEGQCRQSWLPAPCEGEVRVEGIDRQLVGCFDRPDGSRQLSLAGWPLYGYAGDRMPGDANGHGQSGIWFAIRPDGDNAVYVP
ncbi:hypothetical protein O7621_07990 [Solwaraspora sp. WMMD937]|uniref:hypothetical protein n=1 Tax=Solwaraspora sp. WMMD937 TaxID=3016090 RepID=UPI00249B6E6B|nr:hypothetical protein [Solwaraspora sp. WMMD937]WFE23234.1 hypothetical protein O7621_07990 [Solwaraspora sp. WMMD937]